MNFFVVLPFFNLFRTVLGDIFATGYEVKDLIKFERNLVESLDSYFQRQEKNGITFDSAVTNFVADINIKNQALSTENSYQYENPLSRYHVTKRLAKDWPILKKNLTCNGEDCPLLTGEDVFKAVFKREKRDLPSDPDLEDAALTLLHIWDVYDLDIADIAGGKIGHAQDEALLPEDIFFIANVAKDAGKFYTAIKWFEYLISIYNDLDLSETSFKLAHVYRKLASIYHEYGMTFRSIQLLEDYVEKDPENKAISGDLKYFKSSAKSGENGPSEVKRYKDENSTAAKNAETYKSLCQSSLQGTDNPSRLSCYIRPMIGTYGVSKQEVLSLKPRMLLIYDFLDNNETKVLLKYTGKEIKNMLPSKENEKTWTSEWFCERNHKYPFLDFLTNRTEAITSLKVWPVKGVVSSECYRFVYKGIGDESRDTTNYWPKKEAHLHTDNRYVTIRLQLSDVHYGGATVFPKLGIHLPIVKNSAILLWNLKDNGTPDPKTIHRDCPVIIGSNWRQQVARFIKAGQDKLQPARAPYFP